MDISSRHSPSNTTKSRSRAAWSLAIAFALLVFLVPLAMGVWIEKLVHDQIVALNKSSSLSVSVNYYQRGWLSSKMFSRVTFPTLKLTFDFSHKIQHGPVNFDFLGRDVPLLLLAAVSSQPVLQEGRANHGHSTAARIISHVSFSGDVSSAMIPFSYKPSVYDADNLSIQTGPINAQMSKQAQSNLVNAWAQINSARIVGDNYEATSNDLFIRTNRQRNENGVITELYGELVAARYRSGESQLRLSGNWLHSTVITENTVSNIRVTGSISELAWANSSITDLKYDLALRNLPPTFTKWAGAAYALGHLFPGNAGGTDVESGGSIGEKLLLTLPSGIEFEIGNLEFKHANRKVKGWLRASTSKLQNLPKAVDLETFLNSMTLQAEFFAEESIIFDLLESRTREIINRTDEFGEMVTFSDSEVAPLIRGSVESQLNVLRGQRYIDFENGFYSAKVSMKNGRISVNGKPLNLHQSVR